MINDIYITGQLVKRGIKVFLKDKVTVFFSLLSPLIVLVLYVLFLGDMQIKGVEAALTGLAVDGDVIKAYVDGWMLAGVMAVACVTVSFSANNIMVQDKERKVISDAIASPIKRVVLNLSYLIYNIVVTLIICGIVLALAFVYLAISGWYLSVGQFFGIIGLTILSVISSAVLSVFICSYIKSESALGGAIGIMSAAIGFLCGAYLPLTTFPTAIQYMVLVLPATYSAGIFRNLFMNGAFDKIAAVSPEAANGLNDAFSTKLNFFGTQIGVSGMLCILAAFTVLFLAINLTIQIVANKKRNHKIKHELLKSK